MCNTRCKGSNSSKTNRQPCFLCTFASDVFPLFFLIVLHSVVGRVLHRHVTSRDAVRGTGNGKESRSTAEVFLWHTTIGKPGWRKTALCRRHVEMALGLIERAVVAAADGKA
ncbi:hypothetical protein TRVL_07635 [Trypanosoma vivax]|nr:hypothetical protein TRVL_07635 [Trypanosoma vivax]